LTVATLKARAADTVVLYLKPPFVDTSTAAAINDNLAAAATTLTTPATRISTAAGFVSVAVLVNTPPPVHTRARVAGHERGRWACRHGRAARECG